MILNYYSVCWRLVLSVCLSVCDLMVCICIAIWLYICVVDDASKREVSTQPQLNVVLPHAYRNRDVGVDCSACLSCGMVVLLIMTGCRLFHILMVLGKKDDLNTCVRA